MSDLTRPKTPRVDLWAVLADNAKDEKSRSITSDYGRGVEAMRAACIAAVEEVDGGQAVLVFRRHVLEDLREVRP